MSVGCPGGVAVGGVSPVSPSAMVGVVLPRGSCWSGRVGRCHHVVNGKPSLLVV